MIALQWIKHWNRANGEVRVSRSLSLYAGSGPMVARHRSISQLLVVLLAAAALSPSSCACLSIGEASIHLSVYPSIHQASWIELGLIPDYAYDVE